MQAVYALARLHIYIGWFEATPDTHEAVNALARLHIYVGWFESIPDTHEISTLCASSKCSCKIAHIRRLV